MIGNTSSIECEIEEFAITSPPEQVWYAAAVWMDLPRYADITPQYRIANYRADFLVDPIGYFVNMEFLRLQYEHLVTLASKMDRFVIEIDGFEWHDKTPEQAERDKRRDREISQQGFRVYRYAAREVLRDPLHCIEEILTLVQQELSRAGKTIQCTVA